MATREEKLAALNQALASVGTTDPSEAERFLVMWEAMSPFIPKNGGQTSSMMLVEVVPTTDAQKQQAAQIQQQSLQLVRSVVCPAP